MITSNVIQKWLSDEGIFRNKLEDESANFHFTVEPGPQNVVDVIQPKGKKDCLFVATKISVAPEHLQQLNLLSPKGKEEFLWNFRFSLNNMAVDFQLEHPANVLQSFTITDIIIEDGLTKDRLVDTLRKVSRAKLQGIWLIQKQVGIKASETTDSRDDLKSYS